MFVAYIGNLFKFFEKFKVLVRICMVRQLSQGIYSHYLIKEPYSASYASFKVALLQTNYENRFKIFKKLLEKDLS